VLDFGFDSYAAACANNIEDMDKAVLIAWMGVPDVAYPTDEEEWAGCLTLPRELTVRGRRLIQQPLPELKKLRDEKLTLTMNGAGCCPLPRAAELEFDCRAGNVRVKLFTDESGEGGVVIRYDDVKREITVDRSGMRTQFNEAEGTARSRPLENGLSHLRIFVDSSSVEIFVNDGESTFTSRVFPDESERYLAFHAGEVDMKAWSLKTSVDQTFVI
jgi:beta-fructofuranosidase